MAAIFSHETMILKAGVTSRVISKLSCEQGSIVKNTPGPTSLHPARLRHFLYSFAENRMSKKKMQDALRFILGGTISD